MQKKLRSSPKNALGRHAFINVQQIRLVQSHQILHVVEQRASRKHYLTSYIQLLPDLKVRLELY